ncbi:MAG: nitroreductase family protein [Eubacteriales bacterium]|nr:nitroreductase family protein [Eubacteriales bacterium]
MNFMEIANARQSVRSYEAGRPVEQEKIDAILEAARLAPSACNGQPYHVTVCKGQAAKDVAALCVGRGGMNKFAAQAPVMLVVSEEAYCASAGLGAKIKNNDYRSLDIGIVTAFLCCEAVAQGLGTCIMGWFDDEKVRAVCGLKHPVRLVLSLGYPSAEEKQREKKRKPAKELFSEVG